MSIDKVLPDSGLSKYVGEWVIICKNEVIAHDKDLTKLKKDIQNCRHVPTIAKIPKKEVLIF